MKKIIILIAALCLFNLNYSQKDTSSTASDGYWDDFWDDMFAVDSTFFASLQALMNKATGQKVTDYDYLSEQTITRDTVTKTLHQEKGNIFDVAKYYEISWKFNSDKIHLYLNSSNAKLIEFNFGIPCKYDTFRKNSDQKYSNKQTSSFSLFILKKDKKEFLALLAKYLIFPKS